MTGSHLSDEAVAAFADGVLRGLPEQRARRHVTDCAECASAVRVQREAVFALRAAAHPMLSADLMSRLRDVPQSTPVPPPPSALDADGLAVFPTSAPRTTHDRRTRSPRMHMAAAIVAPQSDDERAGLFTRLFRSR